MNLKLDNIGKIAAYLISLLFLFLIIIIGTFAYFTYDLPKITKLEDYKPPLSSKILSRDGEVLAEIGKEKREIVAINDIPKKVVDAFLSAEDDNFYNHSGVDYWGFLRAVLINIKAGKFVQGGSTITQQVAKSLLLSKEKTVSRKIKDMILAQRIEKHFSKEEILYLYLNQVYLGGGYYGVKTAFDGYFGKKLEEATIAESAIIAGLLVAPGKYSPYLNPASAKMRQAYVLKRMLNNGKISETEYEEALKEKIKFQLRPSLQFKAGYFTEWIRQRAIEEFGEEKFLNDGYIITTTLDYEAQKIAEKELMEGIKETDKRQGFKGPIKKIETENEEALKNYQIEFEKKFFQEKSEYFTLGEDNKKIYEFSFSQETFEEENNFIKDNDDKLSSSRFLSGNPTIGFYEHLEEGQTYEAYIVKIDDTNKLIYFSIGNARGVIPSNNFAWARPREITDKLEYYPDLTKPSLVLKRGDVILVRVVRKASKFEDVMPKNYFKPKDSEMRMLAKNQKFILGLLDQEPEVQGALLSLGPKTGEIIAMVGGTDFYKSQFNRVLQGKRQPGSSFKPLLYAAALENGYTPASIIMDSPEALGGVTDETSWKPKNYDGKFKGPITFRRSLEESRNIPTIKIANDLGIQKIKNFCERIGLNAKLEDDLSLSLGSFGVTLLDIVAAYAIFPNNGKKVNVKSIIEVTDRQGNKIDFEKDKTQSNEILAENEKVQPEIAPSATPTLEQSENKNTFLENLNEEQVYDPRLAYIMTNLLKGVVQNGTGAKAKDLGPYIGGKTGTTSSYVDAWFIGFSTGLATGVWIGFDDNKTLGFGEAGSKSALPIWKEFMRFGLKKYGEYDFTQPPGIIHMLIDKETGESAYEGQRNVFMESFVEGMGPGMNNGLQKQSGNGDNSSQDIMGEDEYYNNQ